MQASPHPLMPTFYEAFQNDGHYYIAQEFIVGATLDDIIARRHPLPRDWILKWSVSLCDALAFLHSRQIVHHDLKPANIRITPQGHLVLLDFGAAQYFGNGHENDAPAELYGTEGYLPPELEADGQWIADVRTDIFALGCILYEMIAGVAPDQEQINERSMYVTNSLIQRPNADLDLVRLINKAISYNTEYRYATAGDFLQELREVAPPVLLVSRKHLRFGEVTRGRPVPPMTVTLYNAGGGEISGEIKSRAPWVHVSEQRFAGNHHEVTVTVDPAKTPERDKLVTGQTGNQQRRPARLRRQCRSRRQVVGGMQHDRPAQARTDPGRRARRAGSGSDCADGPEGTGAHSRVCTSEHGRPAGGIPGDHCSRCAGRPARLARRRFRRAGQAAVSHDHRSHHQPVAGTASDIPDRAYRLASNAHGSAHAPCPVAAHLCNVKIGTPFVTEALRVVVTLAVFALTLVLVLIRPRGWNEAWWTVGGGSAMLLLGLETPREAWQVTRDWKRRPAISAGSPPAFGASGIQRLF